MVFKRDLWLFWILNREDPIVSDDNNPLLTLLAFQLMHGEHEPGHEFCPLALSFGSLAYGPNAVLKVCVCS